MTDPSLNEKPFPNRATHKQALVEGILQLHRWPHLGLLLKDIEALATIANEQRWPVNLLERTALYGGNSLFRPFFDSAQSFDFSCDPIETGYQAHWFSLDDRLMKRKSIEFFCNVLPSQHACLTIIPNLLHHVDNPFDFLKSVSQKCHNLYIFDVALEEVHQAPNHWGFFTPDGIRSQLEHLGYRVERLSTTGNAATVAAYFLDNYLQYEDDERNMLDEQNIRKLANQLLDRVPKPNQTRSKTSTPMAWSVYATR